MGKQLHKIRREDIWEHSLEGYEIEGGIPLYGEVKIQGSKNAALPMMAAAVLQEGCVCLENCPDIADVRCMEQILRCIGGKVWREHENLYIDCEQIDTEIIPGAYVNRMRSSVILMGALLGRLKRVQTGYPGGCTIGKRPIDLHLEVLQALGVNIHEEEGVLVGDASGLQGGCYRFPKASVGATENALLAAVMAKGTTVLENCSKEPEIIHLCRFLISMGAKIEGVGESRLVIEGTKQLHSTRFRVPSDRIVAGTYLLAGAITRGNVTLLGAPVEEMNALLGVYSKMGGQYEISSGTLVADSRCLEQPVEYLKTDVYPGFPTDLQSPLLAVCTTVPGVSKIEEGIFEDRYKAARQMESMGAEIDIRDSVATVRGGILRGAYVRGEDLRGGAALVLAGLGAEGITRITEIYHVERGYQNICEDVSNLGGIIRKIEM